MLTEGAFVKAKRYLERQTKETGDLKEKSQGRVTGPGITISRQAGAGSREVATILLNLLQKKDKKENSEWLLFDKNLIEKVIEEHKLPARTSKFLDEEKPSVILSLMNEYLAGGPGTWSLVHKTSETIYHLAEIGNSIIIGRGGNVVAAKLNNAFHVRLVASYDDRVKHVQDYYGLKKDEAIEFIDNDEAARKKYLLKNFNKNIDDPSIYHIIINTSYVDYQTAAEIIADAVLRIFPARMGLS